MIRWFSLESQKLDQFTTPCAIGGARDSAVAYDYLHADNHDTAFRCAIALLVVAVPKIALFLPLVNIISSLQAQT